jgi:hypothetical protein
LPKGNSNIKLHGSISQKKSIATQKSAGKHRFAKRPFKHSTTPFNFVEEIDSLPEVGWEAQSSNLNIQLLYFHFVEEIDSLPEVNWEAQSYPIGNSKHSTTSLKPVVGIGSHLEVD